MRGSTPKQHPTPTRLQTNQQRQMAIPISKLDKFKVETAFGDGHVVQTTYEWEFSSRKIKKLSRWNEVRLIGAGGFGSVWLEQEEGGGQLRAVKRLQRCSLGRTGYAQELLVLIMLADHKHLFVEFLGWYETSRDIYLAMEYVRYGDLSEYMKDNQRAKAEASEITRQILEGLNILHGEQICHRDLKPQNILIASRDPLWIKLADFGTSKRTNNTFLRTRCGTHGYLAPEVQGLLPRTIAAGEAFSNALDMWSLGCILHELLTSQIPFLDVNSDLGDDKLSGISEFESGGVAFFDIDMNMLYGYCQGKADFPSEILVKSDVVEDVIEFVKSLLIANPSLRATVGTALQNPWVTNTGYASTWFMELQREFADLGVELDLGRDRELMMRQLRSTDIALVLPSTTDLPVLLQQALVKRYHSAALALIKSSAWVSNPTAVLALAKQLVSDGRIEFVKSLIPVLPAEGLDSGELLQLAVGGGQVEMVRLLLETGANVDTLIDGRTSLQVAVELGSIDMVKVLLDSKSDVNIKSSDGQTALHMAIVRGAVELIKLLLENKADVNIKSSNGETALHMAIARENVELVKLFLENKADVNIKSNDGQTSLYMAAMCESTEVVNALLDNKAHINAKHIAGQTPLRVAAGGGHLDYAILLLRQNIDINAKSGDGRTALQTAAGGGHTEMVQLLLKHGADINAKLFRIDGGTALRTAASAGHLEMVKLLLTKGADIDAESGRGRTALQAAARRGHTEVVRYLVDNNADTNINSAGVVGQTALRSGARSGNCHIVHFLLMHGANVDGGSSDCRTALQEAAGRGHFDVVKLLLDNHADINRSPSGVVGQTALQAAAGSGHRDIVELLLGRGADANVRSGDGRTALQVAIKGGYHNIMGILMNNPKSQRSITGPLVS